MLNIIFSIKKKLNKVNLRFDLPYKKKIILYDELHSSIFREIIQLDFNILKVRNKKEIYFWIYIRQLIFFDFKFITYCKNYIKFISPKIVITFIDNNIQFYELKNNFNDIKFISIQNGLRHKKWFKSDRLLNAKNLKCDFLFVFNKFIKKKYEMFIKSKYYLLGNFKNNIVKVSNTEIYNEFLYISSPFPDQESENIEIELLKLIKLYLSKSNKKLNILIKFKDAIRQKKEINYYEKIFQSNCIFHKAYEWKTSYEIIDKFENIIFSDSTLGYEAIARKKKIAIFSDNIFDFNDFGWPAPSQDFYNFFLAKNLTFEEVHRILNNIYTCSQIDWEKNYYDQIKDQLYYSKDNEILKKIILDLI